MNTPPAAKGKNAFPACGCSSICTFCAGLNQPKRREYMAYECRCNSDIQEPNPRCPIHGDNNE